MTAVDPLSPTDLVGHARRLIDDPETFTRGVWARAAAFLARQALEATLRRLWAARAMTLLDASFTTQLICLREYTADTALAGEAAHTWAALSAACHHHGYGGAPTADELRAWLATVERLIEALAIRA